MKKKQKEESSSDKEMEEAFLQAKLARLQAFLKEEGMAIQPLLKTTPYGIVPVVNYLKHVEADQPN